VGIEDLSYDQIADVNKVFVSRIRDLKNDSRFKYILIFRNYGQRAGAVIPHPHSQLIATPITPKRVMEELRGARRYYSFRSRCVFCDMMSEESEAKERVVYENSQFLSFCPYASRFPFEIWIVPKIHASDFENIEESAMFELADVLKATLQKLKKALNEPDYNFILHTAPVRHSRNGSWATIDKEFHWHIEIMPRITYVAGFEWGTGFYKNPTPPEEAAKYLRKMDVL
jgi:UDPglucose--hexose-1-phosphate uridylyltransferase